MISRAQLLDVFVDVTDSLVHDFDLVDFLHTLTGSAAEASGAAAAGLVITDHRAQVHYMASSSEEGKLLELFQIQNDEGPCLDAIRTGVPVVNADLGEAAGRWPTFAPAARAAGFQSVHAFPLRLRRRSLGALNIFGLDRARFDPGEVRVVQALADVATLALLHERPGPEAPMVSAQLRAALEDRRLVERARGALARSAAVSPADALDVIRSTARSMGMRVVDVAHSVLHDRELTR